VRSSLIGPSPIHCFADDIVLWLLPCIPHVQVHSVLSQPSSAEDGGKAADGKPQKEAGEPQNEGGEPKEDVGDTSGGAAGGAGKEKSATELCHKSSPHPSSPDILMAECCAEHSAESIK